MTANKRSTTDTQSDPAHDDGSSSDWSSEGGATEEGPATDEDNDEGGREQ